MYKAIVAGTDFSSTAEIATQRADYLARTLGAQLTVVHAGSDSEGALAEIAARFECETLAIPGDPAEVLLTTVEKTEADLLVVGSVGMRGARRFLLGSVPNKVSHHAATDLLIVKTDAPDSSKRVERPYDKILVGTDGSPTATKAVDRASALSALVGATPVIVCVHEPLTEQEMARVRAGSGDALAQWSAGGASEVPEEFRWRIASAAQAQDVLDRAAEHAQRAGVAADTRSIEGNPAETLVSLAADEGFGLIVVGSVGMSGARRFMLGNVPNRISHYSPTDVLILQTSS